MAYDEKLAAQVRDELGQEPGYSERKMFGGLCFLLHGNMACGVLKDELLVRVGKDGYEQALAQPHVRPMDFTGRVSKGMVYVAAAGLRDAPALRRWVRVGAGFATSLPPK